jgi:hypothetical protein
MMHMSVHYPSLLALALSSLAASGAMADYRVPTTARTPFPTTLEPTAVSDQADAKGFMEESRGAFFTSNQYYDADFRSGSEAQRKGASRQSEWGQGLRLTLNSGFTQGPVGVGVDALGLWAIKLDSGGREGKGGRQPAIIFPRDSDGGSVDQFGSLHFTPKIRVSKTELRYGVHQPKWPTLLSSGANLSPQLFKGWMLTSNDIDKLTINLGRFHENKGRASTDFVPMSIPGSYNHPVAGKRQYSNAFNFINLEYSLRPNVQLQYYLGQLEDFYSQHFFGLKHNHALGDGTLSAEWRYYRSVSNGANGSAQGRDQGYISAGYYGNGVTRGEVDNHLFSGVLSYQLGAHTLGAGYQKSVGPSDFPWINQGEGNVSGLYMDVWLNKFQRAGEATSHVRYSYDFAAQGAPGLTAGVAYMKGTGIKSAQGELKERMRGALLSYVIQSGPLRNVGMMYSYGSLRTEVKQPDIDEQRVTIIYSKPLF